jgi:site-specific DNA-methyltransferase (adenine-specific)
MSEPVIIGGATLYNCDCMEYMRGLPDKAFELAIVDPPYGIGISLNPVRQMHSKKEWDSSIPTSEYFLELARVAKNQIVWGGNYFLDHLGATQGFIIWDKKQPQDFSLAMCELAWSSIQKPAKIFTRSVLKETNKIHPTQKPVALYEWLLTNYAKKGDRILDTHLGSGSSAIAAHNLGFDFVGCELDRDYYEAAVKRFNAHAAQQSLFSAANETDFVTKQEALL